MQYDPSPSPHLPLHQVILNGGIPIVFAETHTFTAAYFHHHAFQVKLEMFLFPFVRLDLTDFFTEVIRGLAALGHGKIFMIPMFSGPPEQNELQEMRRTCTIWDMLELHVLTVTVFFSLFEVWTSCFIKPFQLFNLLHTLIWNHGTLWATIAVAMIWISYDTISFCGTISIKILSQIFETNNMTCSASSNFNIYCQKKRWHPAQTLIWDHGTLWATIAVAMIWIWYDTISFCGMVSIKILSQIFETTNMTCSASSNFNIYCQKKSDIQHKH